MFGGFFGESPKPVENHEAKVSVLPAQFKSLEQTKSIYLNGNPGSGKTFLMDSFYDCLPIKRKL